VSGKRSFCSNRGCFSAALGLVIWSLTVVCAATALAGDEEVYLTPDEAPLAIFPEGTSVLKRVVPITPALRANVEALIAPTQPSLWEGSIPIYVVSEDGKPVGYAVLVNEIGKHRPITFVVGVTPDEKVKGVEIMVYREPKGGEVRMKGFLKQYRGKDIGQPILAGRDITNISGATLSVRAVNRGTKKALALIHLVYGPSRTAPVPDGPRIP
jgi:Na+-translocating ferredoxin:NAD+ oxidoreductase RnfG subunit